MAGENAASLSQAQQHELIQLIKGAVHQLPADQAVKALAFGLNLRINVLEALKAAYYTTKVCVTTAGCVLVGHASPFEVIEIAGDAWHGVIATCCALAEKMGPLEYPACVYLSSQTEPITDAQFRAGLTEFLTPDSAQELPWYMGMSRRRVAAAFKELSGPDGFRDLMDKLRKREWLIEADGKLTFNPRNFTLGLKEV